MKEVIKVNEDTQTVSARELHEKLNSELHIFENAEFGQIRTVQLNNETYFVGKDVADAIGYAKARNAIATHVLEEDKKDAPIQGDLGGIQLMTIINESGLYSLIIGSKLESAKRFKHWVTSEVLPSIRKHGVYAIDELLDEPDLAIKAFTALKEERQKNKKLQDENKSLKPKADYFDALVDKKLNTNLRDTAKELGVRERDFVNFLLNSGYVFRQGKKGSLRPYAQYCESGSGLFVLKDKQNENNGWTGQQMYITPKGKESFRLLLENTV